MGLNEDLGDRENIGNASAQAAQDRDRKNAMALNRRDKRITREQIMDLVDEATNPEKMGWEDAKEFLTELASEIHDRAEVLDEENAE